MTYIPQFNFPAFIEAAATLRARGYHVVVPADLESPQHVAEAMASPDGAPGSSSITWGQALAADVILLADGGIDAVVVLPGWMESRGARLETFIAAGLDGKPVLRYRPEGRLTRVPRSQLMRAWNGTREATRHV